MLSDLSLREKATPFLAYVGTVDQLPITPLWVGQQRVFMRCSLPIGYLVECYLLLQIKVATTQDLGIKIGIGRWKETPDDEIYDIDETWENIENDHLFFTGTTDYITATAGNTLLIDGMNLIKKIPKRDEDGYREDGFILIFDFDKVPDLENGYALERFDLECSMLMGVL